MIEIREVKTKKEIKDFLNLPLNMYRDNPYFCPPIYADEKNIFSSKNIYNDQSESVYFNAYKDGKIVGRIQGILQRASNEKHNEKRIRFTRFDSIDDQEVATALFNAVENWGRSKGMEAICGPLGYSDLDREGLLIEGFDQLSTFEEQYNFDYYQKLIENCGYEKEVDWLEFKLKPTDIDEDRLMKVSTRMLKKLNLHISSAKNKKDFIRKYGDKFFDCLDATYVDLYGTVPFTPVMKKMMINNFQAILNLDLVMFILDENERIVCIGLCYPSITKALQKSMGHLTLPCLLKLNKSINNPDILDLGLIGVLPEYANLAVSTYILGHLIKYMKTHNVKHAETNLNLEENIHILNEWKKFDHEQHKRRRAYLKKL